MAPAPEVPPEGHGVWQHRQLEQGLVYRFLSRSFYEPPSQEWLTTLAAERLFEEWPFTSDEEHTTEGVGLLRGFCERLTPAIREELVWDFTRLFVGPGKMLAPPWESVYRSKTELTFQEATLQVREAYDRFGLHAPALHREPDDHIALELAFLAHLSDLAGEAVANEDAAQLARCHAAQKDFMETHLLGWAPACLELVLAHADTDYYRGVAHLTLGALAETARLV